MRKDIETERSIVSDGTSLQVIGSALPIGSRLSTKQLFFLLKILYPMTAMNKNFWTKLKRPFFALAPMAGVTDTVFRQIIARRGKPDVFWTEFVSCDGLVSRGRDVLLRDLSFSPIERPIVAQVFGANPRNFFEAARCVASLGFDGIDINMGCPDKAVLKQGAGAGLIRTPTLAREIIRATKEGAGTLPVSVKTRIGWNSNEVETWVPTILEAGIAALTVHVRTKAEMSDVPAHWTILPRIVEMARGTGTTILGNGDVKDLADGRMKARETGADGIMLGRAVFGNPWLFRGEGFRPDKEEKLLALLEHTLLYESTWGAGKSFDLMKKHYKAYVNGFSGAARLRARLMKCRNGEEVSENIRTFLNLLDREGEDERRLVL